MQGDEEVAELLRARHRERALLGHDLKLDEARCVTAMTRRLAAMLLLEPAPDAKRGQVNAVTYRRRSVESPLPHPRVHMVGGVVTSETPDATLKPYLPRVSARGRETAARRFLHVWGRSPDWGSRLSDLPRTIVYVDGFNFHYAAFRGTHPRAPRLAWLDIARFRRPLLPEHDVRLVRYFTAAVEPVEWDRSQHLWQRAHLRALDALPDVSVHRASFARWKVQRPLVNAPPEGPHVALVWDTKEKGSDVNLATHLLLDAFEQSYDAAIARPPQPRCPLHW